MDRRTWSWSLSYILVHGRVKGSYFYTKVAAINAENIELGISCMIRSKHLSRKKQNIYITMTVHINHNMIIDSVHKTVS